MQQKANQKPIKNDTASRSWFCVLNNPVEHYPELAGKTPQEVCEFLAVRWVGDSETRSGAWVYCVSAEGLHHIHMVLENPSKSRFSAVKNAYPVAHIECTRGNKTQVEDYIYKRGAFEEKGEQVLYTHLVGEIVGNQQGRRNDLNQYKTMIENDGLTPSDILDMDANNYRYESYINKIYYKKRLRETPHFRDVVVYWHFGGTRTGKSYESVKYIEKYGRDRVAFISASSGGKFPFDNYVSQEYLFIDELRADSAFFDFATILSIFDGYTVDVHARYQNKLMLWKEVHVTTPLMPYEMYEYMAKQKYDKMAQLYRRIDYYVYHWVENRTYNKFLYNNNGSEKMVLRQKIVDMAIRANNKTAVSGNTAVNNPFDLLGDLSGFVGIGEG